MRGLRPQRSQNPAHKKREDPPIASAVTAAHRWMQANASMQFESREHIVLVGLTIKVQVMPITLVNCAPQ